MSKLKKQIIHECKDLCSFEILEKAESINLSIDNDGEFILYMNEYRKSLRSEFVEKKALSSNTVIRIENIDNGFHLNTLKFGKLSYYPIGDRLQICKSNTWIKKSGIEFLIKNVF